MSPAGDTVPTGGSRSLAIGEPWWLAIDSIANPLQAAVAALGEGRVVAVMHPSETGDLGVLMVCGQGITPDALAFMLVQARGVPYLALSEERCVTLQLRPQRPAAAGERRDHMVTIEARTGVTTGVSAADRARTMRVATAPGAKASDLITPGHVPPIRVHPTGLLYRPGIPEAVLALAGLAGAPEGAAFCHILDEDGGPGDAAAVDRFVERFEVPLVTTPDILDRMLSRQRLVAPAGETEIDTDHGSFAVRLFRDEFTGERHSAALLGDLTLPEPLPTIVFTESAQDVFGARASERHRIDAALAAIAAEGRGALIYVAPLDFQAEEGLLNESGSRLTGLLHAKRRSHVVTQMLRILGVTSVRSVTPAS